MEGDPPKTYAVIPAVPKARIADLILAEKNGKMHATLPRKGKDKKVSLEAFEVKPVRILDRENPLLPDGQANLKKTSCWQALDAEIHPAIDASCESLFCSGTKVEMGARIFGPSIFHEGSEVSSGAVVGSNCEIGKFSSIGQRCHLGNHVTFEGAVNLFGGGLTVGDWCTFVGPDIQPASRSERFKQQFYVETNTPDRWRRSQDDPTGKPIFPPELPWEREIGFGSDLQPKPQAPEERIVRAVGFSLVDPADPNGESASTINPAGTPRASKMRPGF